MKKLVFLALFGFASCAFAGIAEEMDAKCEAGDYQACTELGMKYFRGEDGLPKDYDKAHTYYDKTCNIAKWAEACYRDGIFHSVLDGKWHNHDRAMLSLSMACEQGHQKACSMKERIANDK
ncbi:MULTISPECIES: hypothetical protein [unclassified Campylobacter]|uniref:hypothetical protein n=1 Tax=unclassified Campylobacter TaxID=2593542 RepID=UPI0022E9E1FF|nr:MULTISPECIES: hypothetical protein [unclassified Campylobacter]MDA3042710.1 hypothetical protein [Campylobacter sp. JMF_09 ED2]MDA3044476.1 hypothetical protein [Campylobacter sp. JMF_07 ED4]MDA3063401.1 hypothetical protein [Campylobacter sp. JMF_11 EL3]MDA3071453.1 hypothetical protein [Campylobacter sp. VBCF_03 NA9]MDA3074483.1 hypothetical protein [Campylobacter sp. JMF_05 ED3]